MVLLPTPPLALATAMTLETSRIRCFGGNPRVRFGIVPLRGRPANVESETLMVVDVECLIDENWDRRCPEYFLVEHYECQEEEKK